MAAPRVRRQAPPWRPRLCDSSDTDSNPALHPTGPAPNTSTGRAGPPPRHSIRWSSTISKRFSAKPPRTTVWATVSLYGWRWVPSLPKRLLAAGSGTPRSVLEKRPRPISRCQHLPLACRAARRSASPGAPVPEEPMNILVPSVNVTSRPLARFSEWSFA